MKKLRADRYHPFVIEKKLHLNAQAKYFRLKNLKPEIMKKLLFLLGLVLFGLHAFAQKKTNQKIEPIGDLFEVTIYYDNGQIMQHGFLTKDNELHASWESYYENGNRKCIATYDHGEKVGTWFYYYYDKRTKVVYDNNKIVSVEEMPLE